MNKFKNLIKNGYLNEALIEIDSELKKSFNLSDAKSRNEYIELKKFKKSLQVFRKSKKKSKKGKGVSISGSSSGQQNYRWVVYHLHPQWGTRYYP